MRLPNKGEISALEKKGQEIFDFGEIIEYVKARGLLDLVKANLKKYVFLHMRRIILSLCLEEPIPQPKAYAKFLDTVTIRKGTLADAQDLHRMMKEHNYWRSVRELREWMEKGDSLLIAIHKGEIIGYACACSEIPSRHSILRRAIKLGPDDAYAVHAFVAPAYRGKMVYHALALEMRRILRAAGYRRLLATVHPLNRAARSANRRLGMKEVAEVEILKLFFFTRTKVHLLRQDASDLFERRGGSDAVREKINRKVVN